MLQVANLREDKAKAVKGLLKRNIENAESLIDGVIALDDRRKALQTELDSLLAESNQISKSIGILMKEKERKLKRKK